MKTPENEYGVPRWALALILIALAVTAYLPSLPGEFIWDDDAHVIDNAVLRDSSGLADIWTIETEPKLRPNTPQYYPVAFTALWGMFQFFELDPGGYHRVNLIVHIVNALLVWLVFARLRVHWAWLIGALFAVTPMHVETAAWAMEIKNLLSAFFYLLAAYVYLRFDERWSSEESRDAGGLPVGLYALALLLFVLALLSKTIACTLPAALILAMLFKRDRIDLRRLAPLLPLFVVGIGLALLTSHFEHHGNVNATGPEFEYSYPDRLLISTRVLLFYPWKLLVPWPMLFCYPRWDIRPGELLQWWSVLAVLGVAVGAILFYRKGNRGLALSIAYFAGTLFPALGLIIYYPMLFSFVADHFCYLPSLGILALFAAVVGYLIRSTRMRWIVAGAMLAVSTALTAVQSYNFRSAEALYRHTLAHNEGAWLVQHQLAATLMRRALQGGAAFDSEEVQADLREARELLERSVELHDTHFMVHVNLASVLFLLGDPRAALPHALRANELEDGYPASVAMVGPIYQALGDDERAREWAERAVKLDANDLRSNLLLAKLLIGEGKTAEAIARLLAAFDGAADPASRRGVLNELGKVLGPLPADRSIAVVDDLVRAAGGDPDLLSLKAYLLRRHGRYPEAIALTEELISLARKLGNDSMVASLTRQLEQLRQAQRAAESGTGPPGGSPR